MKKLTALLLAAMMLFSLAACGDKPNAENTNPPSQQTNGGTDGVELVIGVQEGDLPAVNAAGLVHHVQVGLDAGVEGQNFVEDEKVFAVVGHFGTPVVGATIEDLKDYGIPAVYFAT